MNLGAEPGRRAEGVPEPELPVRASEISFRPTAEDLNLSLVPELALGPVPASAPGISHTQSELLSSLRERFLYRVLFKEVQGEVRTLLLVGEAHRVNSDTRDVIHRLIDSFSHCAYEGVDLRRYCCPKVMKLLLRATSIIKDLMDGTSTGAFIESMQYLATQYADRAQHTYHLEKDFKPGVIDNVSLFLSLARAPSLVVGCLAAGVTMLTESATASAVGAVGLGMFFGSAFAKGIFAYLPSSWGQRHLMLRDVPSSYHVYRRNAAMAEELNRIFSADREVKQLLASVGSAHFFDMLDKLREQGWS